MSRLPSSNPHEKTQTVIFQCKACATKMVERGWKETAVREIVRVVLELGHPHSDKDQVNLRRHLKAKERKSPKASAFIKKPVFI